MLGEHHRAALEHRSWFPSDQKYTKIHMQSASSVYWGSAQGTRIDLVQSDLPDLGIVRKLDL